MSWDFSDLGNYLDDDDLENEDLEAVDIETDIGALQFSAKMLRVKHALDKTNMKDTGLVLNVIRDISLATDYDPEYIFSVMLLSVNETVMKKEEKQKKKEGSHKEKRKLFKRRKTNE